MRSVLAVALICLGLAAQSASTIREPRVVSLSPSITEIIFLLGKSNCLAGRSSYCDYPAEAKKLPVVGNFGVPFLERLAAVKPDYVISNKLKDKASKQAMESLGAKVILLEDNCFDDYIKCVKALGGILNCRAAAEAEIMRFSKALEDFKSRADKVPAASRPKVYVEVWHRPLLTCGGKTFINDMVEYAGGINIGRNEKAEYFSCSLEWIMQENPDVIICPGMGSGKSGEVAKRDGWQHISAVKGNRIYTGLEPDKLFRLGPRTLEGIALLRQHIYAEAKPESGTINSEGKTK
jgi:iron complex transport system substrate-binding protein